MEHLEAILSNRLQLGEALADQVNQNRADLERQLLDRDQDHSRQVSEAGTRLKDNLQKLRCSAEELQTRLLEKDVQQLETEAESVTQKFQSVDGQCQLFEDLLKLKLLKIDNGDLQFVMTHIDPSDPELVFIFTLRLEKDGSYKVFDNDPDISDLNLLVKELNTSKNLGRFVRKVRKAWEQQVYKVE